MAALQFRNGSYRVLFRYQGKQQAFSIGPVEQAEAEAKAGQVDLLLLRLSHRITSTSGRTAAARTAARCRPRPF